jgi:hypothetical protein
MFSSAVIVRSDYMEGFPADLGDVYSHEGYNDTQETNYLHNVDYRKQRFALERLSIIRRHPHPARIFHPSAR